MINTLFYSNYSPVAQTSFRGGKIDIKPKTLEEDLNGFANQLSNLKNSFTSIEKGHISQVPEEVTSIELQFLKPYNKPTQERTLNLSIKTKTSKGETPSEKIIKKGSFSEIREYLRDASTPTVLTEEIKNLAQGATKESYPY